MDYTLFDGFPKLQNTHCLPPSFKLDQADGEFLHEPHLVYSSDTMNHSLELIHNAVRISDTPGGGFNVSI
jgi:hypothetical protein